MWDKAVSGGGGYPLARCVFAMCVFVCVYMCVSVCGSLSLYVCVWVCACACMLVCVCACVRVCVCIRVCVLPWVHVCAWVRTRARVFVVVCTRVFIWGCLCVQCPARLHTHAHLLTVGVVYSTGEHSKARAMGKKNTRSVCLSSTLTASTLTVHISCDFSTCFYMCDMTHSEWVCAFTTLTYEWVMSRILRLSSTLTADISCEFPTYFHVCNMTHPEFWMSTPLSITFTYEWVMSHILRRNMWAEDRRLWSTIWQ